MQHIQQTYPTDLARLRLCAEAWIKRQAQDPVLPPQRPGWPIRRSGVAHPSTVAEGQAWREAQREASVSI